MQRKKVKLPVKLRRGEKLGELQRVTTGNLGQNDTDHYDVINGKGEKVGTVAHTVSTSLRPPHHTSSALVQTDLDGTVVVDKRW